MLKKILFLGIFIAALSLFGFYLMRVNILSKAVSWDLSIEGVVDGPPYVKDELQHITVRQMGSGHRMTLVTRLYPEYEYGDVLRVWNLDFQSPSGKVYYPLIEIVRRGEGNWFLGRVYLLRDSLISKVEKLFQEPDTSLILGVVLGIERDLPEEMTDKLRRSNLTHIIVASGFNVSILVSQIKHLAIFFRRTHLFFLTTFSILVYAFMSGLEPPLIRASIMALALSLGTIVGRRGYSLIWLFYTAFILLVLEPELLFSLSFQLSFLATLALLTVYPFLLRFFYLFPSLVGDSLATSLSVQIITLPIFLQLGDYSFLSLLINALVLWVIGPLMAWSCASILISIISLELAQIMSFPVIALLDYLMFVVNVFS